MLSRWRSDSNSCASLCPQPLVSPCSYPAGPGFETIGRQMQRHGVASRPLTPAPVARSMRPSRTWHRATRRLVDTAAFTSRRRHGHWRRAASGPRGVSRASHPEIGGLMSCGSNVADGLRQLASIPDPSSKGSGRRIIAGGSRPPNSSVINAETSRMLGLTVPPRRLARADEVIE